MSRNTRYNKKLTTITNINEDCSEVSYEEDQYELGESDDYSKDSESTETAEMEGSSDSEEENLFNIRRNKKRRRIISSSDTEDERTSIRRTFVTVQTFQIGHLQHRECEKVAKWATVIKIEAVIAVCIVKISYAGNAQKKFNTFGSV
ncbi:PREDICTED: uncharacterized protein LOC106123531 [Papilio xuthus]|uniref:Uncharacterized protein LOC106123531 n=1 Tax=Papilio xuthus TaxID=66420 RepID=A0AAJ7EFI4_PAPXU|nr:PREDICTED: uncharacterized protein LOC106123531 [Papilio xuthus]